MSNAIPDRSRRLVSKISLGNTRREILADLPSLTHFNPNRDGLAPEDAKALANVATRPSASQEVTANVPRGVLARGAKKGDEK